MEKVVSNVVTGSKPNRGWIKPKSTEKQKRKHQGRACNQILVLNLSEELKSFCSAQTLLQSSSSEEKTMQTSQCTTSTQRPAHDF